MLINTLDVRLFFNLLLLPFRFRSTRKPIGSHVIIASHTAQKRLKSGWAIWRRRVIFNDGARFNLLWINIYIGFLIHAYTYSIDVSRSVYTTAQKCLCTADVSVVVCIHTITDSEMSICVMGIKTCWCVWKCVL